MAAIKRLLLVLVFMLLILIEKKTALANAQVSVPMQCTNYTNLTEKKYDKITDVIVTIIPFSLCNEILEKNGWYRFNSTLSKGYLEYFVETTIGLADSTKHISGCNLDDPGPLHPCRVYETITSKVCFNQLNSSPNPVSGRAVNITHCDAFYVYQLPQFICPKNTTGIMIRRSANVYKPPNTDCNVSTKDPSSTISPTTSKVNPRSPISPTTSKVDPRSPISPPTSKVYSSSNISTTTRKVDKKSNDVLGELKKEVNQLDGKNISDEARKEIAEKIINQLSNLTDLDMIDEGERENGKGQQVLNDTVRILQKIVDLNISDSSLNILGPASNILDSRNAKAWRNMTDEKVIRGLVITLENYGFQNGENLKNNPNASSSSIFKNHSNVQLYVEYIKQASNLSKEERLFKFPDASFNLSPDALPKKSWAVVVVMWYKTMHSFLKNNFYDDNVDAEFSSKIMSASVRPEPRMKFSEPVRISWDIKELNDSTTCVYWKPELNENKWKTDGCVRVKDKSDSNFLICECDHLTAFAAMDISRDMVSKAERQALELISTIGCSVSLFGIFLTIFTYALLWKRLQQNAKSEVPSHVLMHLCVAIGMTDILAILAGPAQSDGKFCISVSILLYFFVLAVFGWMLCEGIIIYLQLVNVYTGLGLGGRHLKVFYLIGWGIPVVVVSVLVGLNDREDFITKRACWCRGGGALFWTFVGTIALILLINLIIFILALRSALSSSEVSTTRTLNKTKGSTNITKASAGTTLKKAKVGLKGSAILLPLLGLTWVFGLLVFSRDTIVFKYLFAICNSLQGLMIFVFHVLINRKIHEAISREKKAYKARHINVMANNNNTCTGGTLSTSEGRRKSSVPVTPVFLKKNFNRPESLAVKNNFTMENNSILKPNRHEGNSRSNGVILEDLEQNKL